MNCKRLGVWISGVLIASTAQAQDLSWTELETMAEPPQVAAAVKMSGRSTPSVPNEIKKLSEIGYAEVTFVTGFDGTGMVQRPLATSPWLLQAAAEGLRGYRIKPIESHKGTVSPHGTRCYLIFNPASAAPRLADSTPRALVVRSAVFPADMVAKNQVKRPDQNWSIEAYADIGVDETGRVTEVSPLALREPTLSPLVVAAVKQWQFAPARQQGVAVASTVRVPVLFTWPNLFNPADLSKVPRVIKQAHPVYPYQERANGFNGEVTVDFVVTSAGKVEDAQVHETNNINFNEPALEAVRKWKFEPGFVGDRAVNTRMRVPMIFDLNGEGRDQYGVTKKKASKLLPPELQYDYPPRVKNAVQGVYPFDELEEGTRAKATVKFAVQPDGKVTFTNGKDEVLSNFDRAARAMIQEFEFIPASKDGKPNWGLLAMEVKFDSGNEQVPVSSSALHILRELRKKEPAILRANQVDKKIEPLVTRAPKFPSSLAEAKANGEALIEFFIDEEGLVQLPRIVSATDPSFGYAGAQAISRWRFAPPTKDGKGVIVKARMPFVFSTSPSSTDAKQAASTPSAEARPSP